MTATTTTQPCPKCGEPVEFEPVEMFPKLVPLCEVCEASQTESWADQFAKRRWRALYRARIPEGYGYADPDLVSPAFRPALAWDASASYGGMGLIGQSGAGKSSAVACRLFTLGLSFRWWSGTEARDAAVEAATADKDRAGAQKRWESAMVVPILVLDDISQAKMTEAWSSKLFDLLETRISYRLPTLWTSQISISELEAKIIRQNSQDTAQAQAIMRRLTQHSLILRS